MSLGSVSLVGAGPGDPELITVKAYKALQSADVIFYDSLLADNFKHLFPKGIPHFHVGKRCSDHTLPQREIELQLIRWARAGYRVIRLKGGDPFIFGRGGEEVQALVDAKIPFHIIPGLSSLNGVASTVGLPLTHRSVVRKVLIVEGHTLGQDPKDYPELARFRGTIAIFMGSKKIPQIAQSLLRFGASSEKSLMLVESDSQMEHHWQIFSLQDAASGNCHKKTKGPGIIYIGDTIDIFSHWQTSQLGASYEQATAPIL